MLGTGVDTNGLEDVFVRDRCVAQRRAGRRLRADHRARQRHRRRGAGDRRRRRAAPPRHVGRRPLRRLRLPQHQPAVRLRLGGGESGVLRPRSRRRDHRAVPLRRRSTSSPRRRRSRPTGGSSPSSSRRASAGARVDDVAIYDRTTGTAELVNVLPDGSLPPGEPSFEPSVSDDGRFVLFTSDSPDLLGPGRDTNGVADLFVRDRVLGVTERASVGTGGAQATDHGGVLAGSLSPDGTRSLFVSGASNLVDAAGQQRRRRRLRARAGRGPASAPISSRTARSTTSCSRCWIRDLARRPAVADHDALSRRARSRPRSAWRRSSGPSRRPARRRVRAAR